MQNKSMQESNTSRQKCGQGGRYVLHSKNKKQPVSQVMRNWEWKPPREPTANKNGKKKKKGNSNSDTTTRRLNPRLLF